jgi:hypothetical protein
MELEPPPPSVGLAAEPARVAEPPPSPAPSWSPEGHAPEAAAGPIRTTVIPLVILVAAMLLAAWTAFRVGASMPEAELVGRLLGSIIGVLLIAGIALVIARKVVGPGMPARYRLIAAVAALLLTMATSAASLGAAVRAPADPAAAMVIAAPYSLAPASAQIEQAFGATAGAGEQHVTVRLVTDEAGTTVAIMVAQPAARTPEFWEGFDRGFTEAVADGTLTPTTFQGQEAREFHGNGVSGIAWIGPDQVAVAVYADSDAVARSVAEAQVRAVGTR